MRERICRRFEVGVVVDSRIASEDPLIGRLIKRLGRFLSTPDQVSKVVLPLVGEGKDVVLIYEDEDREQEGYEQTGAASL